MNTTPDSPQVIYVKSASNGPALAALIFALAALAFGLVMAIVYPITLALALVGVVLSFVGRRTATKLNGERRQMAAWATVLSAAAMACGIWQMTQIERAVGDLSNAGEQLQRELDDAELDAGFDAEHERQVQRRCHGLDC
jgi:hypothetical protein